MKVVLSREEVIAGNSQLEVVAKQVNEKLRRAIDSESVFELMAYGPLD